MISDAEWLKKVPREIAPEEVERRGLIRDQEEGPYVPHEHRSYYGEAGH